MTQINAAVAALEPAATTVLHEHPEVVGVDITPRLWPRLERNLGIVAKVRLNAHVAHDAARASGKA